MAFSKNFLWGGAVAAHQVEGGWCDRRVIELFVRHATTVMERYKNKVKYWMTLNEINNQKNTVNPLFAWTCSGINFKEDEKFQWYKKVIASNGEEL